MNNVVSRLLLSFVISLLFCPPVILADLTANQHIDGLVTLAEQGNDANFVDYIKKNDILDLPDQDGHTPVFAAMFGSPGLISDVIDLGGSLEVKDQLGFTPLISAALLGYPQAVETLLKKGADINARNDDGQTAMMVSVLGLAANNVDISASGDNQWHNNWEKVIEILINKGADVSAADRRGVSPLFMAIFAQDYALCRRLIQAGANVNHKLPSGVSMLQFARVSSSRPVIDLLISSGASH